MITELSASAQSEAQTDGYFHGANNDASSFGDVDTFEIPSSHINTGSFPVTISISSYGNSIPDLSDIAIAYLPVAYFAIMYLGNKL